MFRDKRHSAHSEPRAHSGQRHRRHQWRTVGIGLIILAVLLGVGRAILPWVLRDYVNRTLDRNQLYSGKIGNLRIQLMRGAYSIEDISISKTTGNVPVPFFAARRVDFSVQWSALLERKAVGQIIMEQPELNFVDASSEGETQTGADAPWLEIIRDLFPFKINSAIVRDGSIHFRVFQTDPPVDVYLSEVQATIDNLSNIRDETNPLVSTVQASALAMDHAKFEYKMAFDPFSYRPTFHMAARLMGLDVTKINDLALAYGKFDFKRGWFDFVIESNAQEGLLTGYAKPLFRDLKIFSLTQDLKEDTVLEFFWQALVGAVTAVLSNQSREQFGTLIPFSGDLTSTTTTDMLATIGNILRNAFVRAYLPRLESGKEEVGGLMFAPPEFTDAISSSDSP